jgi:lipopolysaccharide export system protein LptA
MRLILPLFAALLTTTPVAAQLSVLRNHDVKAPFDLAADRFEVRDKDGVSLFTGNVVATQGNLKLAAARARAYYERSGMALTVRRVDTQGGVVFTSPSEQVKADWGVYDLDSQVITLGGDVTLLRGQDVLTGQRVELNLRTGVLSLDGRSGSAAPQGSTAAATGGDGRVRARFSVPERKGN